MKISLTVSKLWSGHEKLTEGQTDVRTDGQTDRWTDRWHNIIRPVFDGHIKNVKSKLYHIENS